MLKVKRMQWQDSDMKAAMEEVRQGKGTPTAIARKYNVPRRTLTDRMKGRVQHGRKPGPSTALSKAEEDALVAYLVHMAKQGFPLTPKMTTAYAWAIAIRSGNADRFPKSGPSRNWFTRFRKRHQELRLRKMDNLERTTAECLSPEVVGNYFDLLEKTMTENCLKNKPRQIYNADETFLPLNETKEKAVTLKNSKCVFSQSLGTTEHITLLCGGSASGSALPPMIIYPKSFPGGQYKFGGPDDAVYASESGWVDSELFIEWMKRIFLRYAVPERPVLLLIDGHKSHLTLECIDLARENQVILLCLPPHTTHALQPLDVAVFKALKAHFSRALRVCCFTKKNFMVSKRDFARIVKEPFEFAFSMVNLKSGFSKCGIFPFNRNAVSSEKMAPSTIYQKPSEESSSNVSVSERASEKNDHPATGEAASLPGISSTPTQETSVQDNPSRSTPIQTIPSTPVPDTDSSEVAANSSTFTPPLFSTPNSSVNAVSESSGSRVSTPIVNPLIMAGLVPSNLGDILAVADPESNQSVEL